MKTNRFISLLLCVIMIMSLFTGLAGSASADDVITHEVKSGQTLVKICDEHGLNYYTCKDAIMALNGFTSEAQLAKLSVGQKIRLPGSNELAKTATTTTAVVTSTTVGGTTTTTTTTSSGIATGVASGSVAYYLTPYTVQAGDTLNAICNKLGSNYYYYSPVILAINALANANYIQPGQVLLIPTTSAPNGAGYSVIAHKVQNGETVTSICNRYGVSYQAMRQLVNGLNRRDNMDKIYAGQTVYVPAAVVGSGATTTATTTTTTTSGGTGSGTSSGSSATVAGASYKIIIPTSNYGYTYAVVGGKEYVNTAEAGVEVSVRSISSGGYVASGLTATRLDTFEKLPIGKYSFTMPNADVMVEMEYKKGLTITKAKTQGGSFDTVVRGSVSSAAFPGDEVTILAYPNQYYSVSSVSYQKSDYTVTAVDVKQDDSGNFSFTMPNYPVTVKATFKASVYHKLSYSGVVGQGQVRFAVNNNYVNQAEQGQTVTMIFEAVKGWVFNTADFENNLAAHIPNKASMGSFKKINDNTYTFVMGSQDINVLGAQFINRNTYTLDAKVWLGASNKTNGQVWFNVFDQTTGNWAYHTNKAKFGDTVEVIYKPNNDFVPDYQYAKNNSRGAGNALLSWGSDTRFTMPDSNVTVNARFIQDGASHKYAEIARYYTPAEGGWADLEVDGNAENWHAEIGKVVVVKVHCKPNYELGVIRIVDGNPTFNVTLNGASVDAAPAGSNFKYLGYDPWANVHSFSFVKGSGVDTIRVAFASHFLGVNATFKQITEGGETVVQGIRGFAVNGNLVQSDVQLVSGDTVSFGIDLKEGYEIMSVRKYAREKSSGNEIPGTSTIIPGGSNNTYSYTVTSDDIGDAYDRELVFEITCRKNPETYYTVKYTSPKINGHTPLFCGDYGFTSGDPCFYYIGAYQISSGEVLPLPSSPTVDKADVNGISGNLVEANDVMVRVWIPKDNVYVFNQEKQIEYYTFDKLLLNGVEYTDIDGSADDDWYIANVILPKGVPDCILTTEVVYKHFKTDDAPHIIIKTLEIDGVDCSGILQPGIYDYTLTSHTTPSTWKITTDPSIIDSAEVWLNDKLWAHDMSKPFDWVTGPNKVVIKMFKAWYADTTYTFTVNYGLEASELKTIKVKDIMETKEVGMYSGAPGGFSGDPSTSPGIVTSYETSTWGFPKQFEVASKDGNATITWILNGYEYVTDDPAAIQDVSDWDWQAGKNTLELIVKEKDADGNPKSPTKYTVIVNVEALASELASLQIESVNGYNNIIKEGTYDYAVTVTKNPIKISFDTLFHPAEVVAYFNDDGPWTYSTIPVTDESITLNPNSVNTIILVVTQEGFAPTTYTVKVTPKLDAVVPILEYGDYLKINDNMVKFKNLQFSCQTEKSNADFEITFDSTDVWVKKMAVNGVDLNVDDSGAPTYKASVGSGSTVESWNVGSNTFVMVLEGTDLKETTYTVTVNYKPEQLKLLSLTLNGSPISLANSQSLKADAATGQFVAAPEKDDVAIVIRFNGAIDKTEIACNPTTPAVSNTLTWDTTLATPNYVDILLTKDGYGDGAYHIEITP